VIAIELFPCSGGMAEGFRRAGVVFDLAFDKDPDACDSYEVNHGHRPIEMDVRDLLRMVREGWTPRGPVDLLVADPPCTPWSRAGKRLGIEDGRDMLADTCELIQRLKPHAYLIGNVPGLQDATQWHHVQKFIGGLGAFGYCVADYVSLDAADYGVPQHRVRPFWFGHFAGPCIRWPDRTHAPIARTATFPGMPALAPWVTCRDALGHLTGDDLGRPVRIRWKSDGDHRPSDADEPAKTLAAHDHSDGAVLSMRRGGVNGRKNGGDDTRCSSTDAPARTVVANANRKGGAIMLTPNAKHPINSPDLPSKTVTSKGDCRGAQGSCAMEWPWERPATTVMADERLPPPGHHDPDWKDKDGNRQRSAPNAVILSERAAAILQGFPESWRFCGKTKGSRSSQLGQAMPPPLAEAVARSVVAQLKDCRPRPAVGRPDGPGTDNGESISAVAVEGRRAQATTYAGKP